MLKRLLFTSVMLLSLLPNPAAAGTLIGPGVTSCGSWLAKRAEPGEHYLILSWALGYLSAYNGGVDPLKNADANAVMYWLDNHCHKYPTERFSEALLTFVMFEGR